jgi:CheY-like chemotaxis protein
MDSTTQKNLKNVLVIEDDPASQFLMQEAFELSQVGSTLHFLESGMEILDVLRQKGPYADIPVPDLILLDLNLPGKNGIQVLQEIRDDKNFKDIPVIILTGSNAPTDFKSCAKLQCRYLLKPSRFPELINLIKSLPDMV